MQPLSDTAVIAAADSAKSNTEKSRWVTLQGYGRVNLLALPPVPKAIPHPNLGWNSQPRLDALIRLVVQGYSASQISNQLGVSRNAVIGKVRRLDNEQGILVLSGGKASAPRAPRSTQASSAPRAPRSPTPSFPQRQNAAAALPAPAAGAAPAATTGVPPELPADGAPKDLHCTPAGAVRGKGRDLEFDIKIRGRDGQDRHLVVRNAESPTFDEGRFCSWFGNAPSGESMRCTEVPKDRKSAYCEPHHDATHKCVAAPRRASPQGGSRRMGFNTNPQIGSTFETYVAITFG